MTPSIYQTAIYNEIAALCEKESGALAIEAVAGSGKTTTIVDSTKLIPSNFKVLFCAFNKHIADELRKRVPSNVQASTLNSFGFSILRGSKLDAAKTENILRSKFDLDDKKERSKFYKYKSPVSKLISLLKANNITENYDGSTFLDMAAKYGISISENSTELLEYVDSVYREALSSKKIIDFDDQIFMPIHYNMDIPQYDLVMVDESQDLNPIQIELILRVSKRIVAVGDSRQAIYGFRGANPEAMKDMINRTGAKILPLSICYRCPKAVVAAAKNIVPQIEPSPTADEGIVRSISMETFKKESKDGDYVLCRTTAPLISACLKMIREGRKATVKGRDIGKSLEELINAISFGQSIPTDRFYEKLQNYRTETCSKLARANREAEILNVNDRCDTLAVILEDCKMSDEMKTRINQIFSDDNLSGIVFSTVHKSKGLEADTIFVLNPELMPHPSAKQKWQIEQEMNLKYVCITRAKKELNWVG